MFTHPTKPHSVATIYLEAFKFWQIGFTRYFPLLVICVIIGVLPHYFVPELNTFHIHITVKLIENHRIFFILYAIFTTYAFSAILSRIYLILSGNPGGLGTALIMGAKRLPFLIVAVLITILTLLVTFALFIVPGIIFALLLSMYFVLVIVDKEGLIQGFKHSCDLVWGNWWRTAAVLAVPSLLFWVVAYFIEVATIDVLVLHLSESREIWLLHNTVRAIFNIIYFPWFCALLLLQLNDLKLRNREMVGETIDLSFDERVKS